MPTTQESKSAADTWDVVASDGCYIGAIHVTPYGWFANPRDSQIQMIPCTSREDSFSTVIRHGGHPQGCTNNTF